MNSKNHVWINGEFFPSNQPVLGINNRSFAYGDGLFETIHAYGTEGKHLDLHYARLISSMQILGMVIPPYLTLEFLSKEIIRLLNKNRYFGSTRVRVSVYRTEGGYYTPESNTVEITMQATQLTSNFYEINPKGLIIDIFSDIRKPINKLSPIKSCNSLVYIMAGLYKKQHGLDDCLIINDQNRIAEATSSNLFLVIGNTFYTPKISEGCVRGIMRELVLQTAPRLGYIVEETEIKADMLSASEEIFLTNAVKGVQWVVGLKHKRYFGLASRKISQAINRETFGD